MGLGGVALDVDGARISAVRPCPDAPSRPLVPGFVDLQCNGMEDLDVATASGRDWDRLDRLLLQGGVTTWCPTLVTAPPETYGPRLRCIAAAAARPPAGRPHMAGAHLEGPFLGGRPGAHPVGLLRPIDHDWLAALPPVVRLVTLAPELAGAQRAIAALVGRGVVVSLGHGAPTVEQVLAAVDAGAAMVTHLFNGMPPFHHRDPGLAGVALTDDRLVVGLIADLVHVHPTALRLALRAKGGDGVALVTDAVARAAREAGALRLADGTLAGSALTMVGAVRNVVSAAGVDLATAVTAASTTPARLLGLTERGRLCVGARADVVALTDDLEVEAVWVGGERVVG